MTVEVGDINNKTDQDILDSFRWVCDAIITKTNSMCYLHYSFTTMSVYLLFSTAVCKEEKDILEDISKGLDSWIKDRALDEYIETNLFVKKYTDNTYGTNIKFGIKENLSGDKIQKFKAIYKLCFV